MKKFIFLLAMMGITVGTGLCARHAQASGYWDYTMGQRGTVFSGSPSAAKAECDSEQNPLCQDSTDNDPALGGASPENLNDDINELAAPDSK